MKDVPQTGPASNVVAFPTKRPRPHRPRSGPPLKYDPAVESDGRLICEVCGQCEGECISDLHAVAEEETRARHAEEARKRRLDADALADALVRRQAASGGADVPLSTDLVDAWVASIDGSTEKGTRKEYRRIALVQWVPFFGTLGAIGARVKAYTNDRLKRVSKTMHKKELSALRGFVAWLAEHEYIADSPRIPPPPRRATGTPSTTAKHAPVPASAEQIEEMIARLPEWSQRARRGPNRHRIRDVFVLWWETGLRPITIARLTVPEHWKPGKRTLTITAKNDKARFARELPLTPRAIKVLERCAPKQGLIFGRHDYRTPIKKVAIEVLGEEGAKHFSKYDVRHSRADFLLDETQDPRAVAFGLGHKLLSTTLDKYTRPSQRNYERALAKITERSAASAEPSGASARRARSGGVASIEPEGVLDESLSGEYTSASHTRTWRNWQTHQIQVLAP